MAWYYGTYSCGHEGRVNVIGPHKDREWKINNKFSKMCPDCIEKAREVENKESAEEAKEMELPDLTGSEKQIAWANTIRVKAAKLFDHELEIEENENKKELLSGAFQFVLKSKTKASWWIDTRTYGARNIGKEALKEMKDLEEEMIPESVVNETIIKPDEVGKEGIVTVTVKSDSVSAEYVKDDDFIAIVKSLGFKWNKPWTKQIGIKTGSAEDRAAELGNKLLNSGFVVQIQDADIREKAINADYEPECKRWIMHNITRHKLSIDWEGKDDRLYNASKKIKSAKWSSSSKSILVDIEFYAEIEDFAQMFDFKFSPGAINEIKSFKNNMAKIKSVEPSESKVRELKDGLEDVLESSREVINDLVDD